jgi:Mg-chelatase subunit ChlD
VPEFRETTTHTVATPRFLGLPLPSRHVTFVIDASGSMSEGHAEHGTRWAAVCAELRAALDRMDGAHVNVIRFAGEARAAFPRAAPLTAARRAQIERFLADPPAGRTALYDGIALALEDPEVDTVVVLSDGAPSAGSHFTKSDLLAEVRRGNRWRRARIDVVSVGSDGIAKRWRDVLRRIADDSGGTLVEV